MPELTPATLPYTTDHLPINAWAEEDRPREKLLLKGRHSLTDAELIAILLGKGSRGESALALAQRLLATVKNDLTDLARLSLQDLMLLKGVGTAKAVSIAAALELGRRRQLSPVRERPVIRSSNDAYGLLGPLLLDLSHEEFWMLCLNRANRVISREHISTGGTSGTVVDAKIIYRKALRQRAVSVVLAHNHPSGNLRPSEADIVLTHRLQEAGKTLNITVLDHLIIADQAYYSFADEGMLQ